MTIKQPKPPSNLKAKGRRFWTSVLKDYSLDECHDLERLHQAAMCLDEIEAAEAVKKSQGLYVQDRFGQVREHPAQKTIRDSRTLFLRCVRELGLDIQTLESDFRPRRQYE